MCYRLTKVTALAVIAVLSNALPATCADGRAQTAPLAMKVERALAYDCQTRCKSIAIDLNIVNTSEVTYCVPEYYKDYHAAQYVTVKDVGAEYFSLHSVGLPPPNASGGDDNYISWLRSGANILIQPHKSISFRTLMDGHFDIPISDSESVTIKIFAYPCADADLEGRGAQIVTMSARLSFQRD